MGSVSGKSPMSETVRTSRSSAMEAADSTTMVTSGEGMAVVSIGNR